MFSNSKWNIIESTYAPWPLLETRICIYLVQRSCWTRHGHGSATVTRFHTGTLHCPGTRSCCTKAGYPPAWLAFPGGKGRGQHSWGWSLRWGRRGLGCSGCCPCHRGGPYSREWWWGMASRVSQSLTGVPATNSFCNVCTDSKKGYG